eukprot:gene10014-18642_t
MEDSERGEIDEEIITEEGNWTRNLKDIDNFVEFTSSVGPAKSLGENGSEIDFFELCSPKAMIKLRERSSFEQYLPAKPTKYGIRLGMRGDQVNRYCNDIRVYPGKPTGKEPEKNLGQKGVTIDKHKHLTVRDYGEEASFVLADVSKQIVKSLELKKQKMHQYQKDSRLSPVISNKLLSADIVPVSRHSERDEDTLPCSYDYSSDNSMFSDSDSPYSASEDDDVDVNRSQDNNLCYPKRIWKTRLFQGCLPWTVLTL